MNHAPGWPAVLRTTTAPRTAPKMDDEHQVKNIANFACRFILVMQREREQQNSERRLTTYRYTWFFHREQMTYRALSRCPVEPTPSLGGSWSRPVTCSDRLGTRGWLLQTQIKVQTQQTTESILRLCLVVMMQNQMNGVLGHDSTLVRLYWAGTNLGEWDKLCYESRPWCRVDRSTCWPAVQHATTVPRMPPKLFQVHVNKLQATAT